MPPLIPASRTGEYSFQGKLASEVPVDKADVKAVEGIFAANGLSETFPLGVGVDQGLSWQRVIKILYTDLSSTLELTSAVPSHNPTFVSRNFTDADPSHHHHHHSLHAGGQISLSTMLVRQALMPVNRRVFCARIGRAGNTCEAAQELKNNILYKH